MTSDDFDDKGYECAPLSLVENDEWKTKPEDEWTEDDIAAYRYQQQMARHHEMWDAADEIE